MPRHQPQFNPPARDNELAIRGLTSNIVEHVGERIVLRELTLFGRRLSLLRFGGVAAFAAASPAPDASGAPTETPPGSARRARNAGSDSRFVRANPRSLASLGIRTFPARSRVGATGDRIGGLPAGGPVKFSCERSSSGAATATCVSSAAITRSPAFARASSTIMSRRVSRNEPVLAQKARDRARIARQLLVKFSKR